MAIRSLTHGGRAILAAACLTLWGGCSSRAADPAVDLGTKPEQKRPSPDGGGRCPEAAPSEGSVCDEEGLECKYVRAYCPENPMGPFYQYEHDIYLCMGGLWSYEGQDCYDCCRPRQWWPAAGPSADGGECIPPAPSPGCDYCGNLECPPGSSIDSACKCLNAEGNGYVTPLAQTCDFCCGKICPAGQFLDFACDCYSL